MKTSSSPLSEQASNEIMDMIFIQHRFHPGDKLPNELDLAEELGISRITLREAIRILCTRGLVEIRRGRGTYVISNDPALRADPGSGDRELTDASARDLMEFRLALEPAAAYYAARRADEQELQHMDSLLSQMEKLSAQGQSVIQAERDFHCTIAAAGHNPLFGQLMPVLQHSIQEYNSASRERTGVFLRDYREIVRYIRDRNAEAARAAMFSLILLAYRLSDMEIE
ncbi:MAG: FadR family transcriptional regulator [Oscillibacter sp.]|nr:FadR family transcriptional regulator [Oscillibacter sp.]